MHCTRIPSHLTYLSINTNHRKVEEARGRYTRALELHPSSVFAFSHLGTLEHFEAANLDAAELVSVSRGLCRASSPRSPLALPSLSPRSPLALTESLNRTR